MTPKFSTKGSSMTPKNSGLAETLHDAITFQLLDMSSITTPNQKQFGIFPQGTFFKGFIWEISAI